MNIKNIEKFNINTINLSKYIFFTGKGGVGKTSTACSTAISLADIGKKVLLISTDPASNLQDVFNRELNGKGIEIPEAPGLVVANLNPEEAAAEYRESIVAPYRGKLPESVILNMEEQLSGSCTVEIAAFDQFSEFISNKEIEDKYDHIVFDTAPTGHTLRMLQLPSAWTNFIDENTTGASCMGQLSGLGEKRDIYRKAMENLADKDKTTLILVTRPDESPLLEAERSSLELRQLGVNNQVLVINGILNEATDDVSKKIFERQAKSLNNIKENLKSLKHYSIPLRSYDVLGLDKLRSFLKEDSYETKVEEKIDLDLKNLNVIVEDLYSSNKKVIFTMGKGGVGKTSIAASIALALAHKGLKVHLTSTDPANHLSHIFNKAENVTVSQIDEKVELQNYTEEVLNKARETMSEDDLDYIKEDLRSPCTQEIALFRAFAEIVHKAENEVVVIDTAPSGHTLLLLDSTQSHHRELERSSGETPISVENLLPRLRDEKQTAVIIVTLPEATPVYEASRLRDDLHRAGITNKWWIVNQSLLKTETSSPILLARAHREKEWLMKVKEISKDNFVALPWLENPSLENLLK